MCGIAGILDFRGLGDADLRAVRGMTETLRHRGPDDSGFYEWPDGAPVVALGHTRLSIIDLSAGGHQPMADPTGRYWIVYNGEVYNYRELRVGLERRGHVFTSSSDTEVLLRLYTEHGTAALAMMEGMFALAIWDEWKRTLFIARDRLGKKPFFYHFDKGRFIFASELKAILSCPGVKAKVDERMLSTYLTLRYVPAPRSLFEGILKLEPAHCGVVDNGGIKTTRWWEPMPGFAEMRLDDEREYREEFLRRLTRAVEKRLVADVPVGAFLSGGIDSSSVVWAMSGVVSGRVKTFSVGFDDPWESELEYARMAAQAFGTDHHEIIVQPEDYINELGRIVWHRDLPISEPADVPIYLLSRLAAKEVKVVLSGEGGDEILGGYYKNLVESFSYIFSSVPEAFRRALRRGFRLLPYRFRHLSSYLETVGISDPIVRSFMWFASMEGNEILTLDIPPDLHLPEGIRGRLDLIGCRGIDAMAYIDLGWWLPDNLLERADRLTMSSSIELRAPFLDHCLVEFCCRLPRRMRVRGLSTKVILREAMEGKVPHEIIKRGKKGFPTPIGRWFRKELRGWAADIIFSKKCIERGMFHMGKLRKIFDEHVRGTRDNTKALWTIINLELWCEMFIDTNNPWKGKRETA